MTAKDAIRATLKSSQSLLNWLISDLSDTDLLVRPVPEANHIAWQLGHLIVTEHSLRDNFPQASYPELPPGFVEQHGKATAAAEPAVGFLGREQYAALFQAAREATLHLLDGLEEGVLDQPTQGPLAGFAPTLGALLLLESEHTLMHAGQFSVVRRKLGKPVLM
jgi:hypothetical protein